MRCGFAVVQTWARRYQDIPDPAVRAAIADVVSGNREHGFFIVPANDLGFSVGLFCVVALLCLLTFGLRRKFAGECSSLPFFFGKAAAGPGADLTISCCARIFV